jgi:anti-anti-sigma factor
MTHERAPVALVEVPETLKPRQERIFLRELESCMNTSRPRIVLDCSKLRQMDKAAIHLLLCCLEEALKHNGDIRLAAVPKGASGILDLSGLGGLFEVFDTIPAAVSSFHRVSKDVISQREVPRGSNNNPSIDA